MDDASHLGEGLQYHARRMTEPVARPHADESDARRPLPQRSGHVAIRTSVMGDLHHIHRAAPRFHRATLRPLLGIPEQDGAFSAPLHQQDHARVVRIEQSLSTVRPQHSNVRLADVEGHVPPKADHLARETRTLCLQPLDILVYDVGNGYPARSHHAGKAFETTGMVLMCVSEHEPVKRADPRSRQCSAQ